MEPILKVSGLTKTFSRQGQADFTAVKNIGFELFPGECLAIIGESGSGKTTAVNMIARLVESSSGSVFLDGEDITHLKGKPMREIYRTMQMVSRPRRTPSTPAALWATASAKACATPDFPERKPEKKWKPF